MPSNTYANLSPDKRQAVLAALVKEFETYPLPEATVKHIVERLGIPRGSFYQYFDSLTESYFFVLEQEVVETHALFLKTYQEAGKDLRKALAAFGEAIAQEIFESGHYALYRNRFLYWNPELDREWRSYLAKQQDLQAVSTLYRNESMRFVSAVVHSLIQRLFLENWDRPSFLEHFAQHLEWILGGIDHVSSHGTLI